MNNRPSTQKQKFNNEKAQRRITTLLKQYVLSRPLSSTVSAIASSINNNNHNINEPQQSQQQTNNSNHAPITTTKDENLKNESSSSLPPPQQQQQHMTTKSTNNNMTEKPIITSSSSSLSTSSIGDYSQEFYDLYGTKLETGQITPQHILNLIAQMVNSSSIDINDENNDHEEDHDDIEKRSYFERARVFALELLPYLKEMDELDQQQQQQTDNNNNNNSSSSSNSNDDASVRRVYRIVGLTHYKMFEYDRALPWFRKAARRSQSINDWFNLCTTAAQVDQGSELAMHAFEQLEVLHKSSRFQLVPSFWNQLYLFSLALLNGRKYALALELLNRLKLAYKRARFTDAEYLAEVGLPPFEDFLSLVVTLFQRVNRSHQTIQFLKQMQASVDNAGKAVIDQLLPKIQEELMVS